MEWLYCTVTLTKTANVVSNKAIIVWLGGLKVTIVEFKFYN